MKKILLFLPLIILFKFGYSQNTLQNVIASSGGFFVSSNTSISWTLGETAISTIETPNGIITQGFHQCHFNVTSVGTTQISDLQIMLYPNPARENINVNINSDIQDKRLVELIDMSGKILNKSYKYTNQFKINLANYSPGFYYLRIGNDQAQLLGTYKIVKYRY